jgi:hypothetical protein
MKYIIYKITNLINNRYYIGAHATNDENDRYFGSGSLLKEAIKKYGKSSFKKEILEVCKNAEHMFLRESEIVDINVVNDDLSYNIKLGGKGGKGSKKSEAHKEAIRKSVIENYKGNPNRIKKKGIGVGRKFPEDSKHLFETIEQHGFRRASEILNIPYESCRHRYYRYKKAFVGELVDPQR